MTEIDYDPHAWDDDARKAASTWALKADNDIGAMAELIVQCVKERPAAYVVALIELITKGHDFDDHAAEKYREIALLYQQSEDYARSQGNWRSDHV